MNKFKSIIMSCNGKSKTFLHWLYNTHSDDIDEEEKVFVYKELTFWFTGTGFRNTEKLILSIGIPASIFDFDAHGPNSPIPVENYILHLLFPIMSELQKEYRNDKKDQREKAGFRIQSPDGCMDKKSGCRYDRQSKRFVLQMHFNVPLVNATSVNSKAAFRAVKDIMEHIDGSISGMDMSELMLWCRTYTNQESIRKYMRKNHICAFVADGSILPRASDSDGPLPGALSFESPENMRISVTTDLGETITGMGIKEGITVITGGGYSGKTTLLNAIESGIYNHIPGDGREYVLSDSSALKTNAEDGRPVSGINLSPFFKSLNSETTLEHFSTKHASGSVSQAANIIEAIGCGSKLLLVDEDKSATNFMIRDKLMRKIVPDEPIIPLTDRIEELRKDCGVSTILVIGGSSEYLAYADTVILMKEFRPLDITDSIGTWNLDKTAEVKKASWASARKIKPLKTSLPFLFFRSVVTENEKKIVLDNYSADITNLTALTTPDRLNTVMRIMESLLTDKEADSDELLSKVTFYTNKVISPQHESADFFANDSSQRFFSEIRPVDAWCCINRMRGVEFF